MLIFAYKYYKHTRGKHNDVKVWRKINFDMVIALPTWNLSNEQIHTIVSVEESNSWSDKQFNLSDSYQKCLFLYVCKKKKKEQWPLLSYF